MICTDVTGVFTSDPRFIPKHVNCHLFPMMKCLNLQILVQVFCIPERLNLRKIIKFHLEVRSSTEDESGTVIEEEVSMEKNLVVRGVALKIDITRLQFLD